MDKPKMTCCWIMSIGQPCGRPTSFHYEQIEPGVKERRPNPYCAEHAAKAAAQKEVSDE